jgi:ribosome maturation factor RimP
LTDDVIKEKGLEPAGVDFVKENGTRFLRVYIYKKDGVGIEDCLAVHRGIEPLIDSIEEIKGPFTLEVSSPGYDRPLKTEADFKRYEGERILVKLYKPFKERKKWEGVLEGFENGVLKLGAEEGVVDFDIADTASIKRIFEF